MSHPCLDNAIFQPSKMQLINRVSEIFGCCDFEPVFLNLEPINRNLESQCMKFSIPSSKRVNLGRISFLKWSKIGILELKFLKLKKGLSPVHQISAIFKNQNPIRVDPFIKPNKNIETVILVTSTKASFILDG